MDQKAKGWLDNWECTSQLAKEPPEIPISREIVTTRPLGRVYRSAIRRLASSAEQAPVDPHEQFRKFTADTTPAQFLAGKLLRETYEKYLGRRPGSSRLKIPGEDYSDSGAKAGGPYIRFVAAAFRELGVVKSSGEAYGGETIVKALTQAKGGEK